MLILFTISKSIERREHDRMTFRTLASSLLVAISRPATPIRIGSQFQNNRLCCAVPEYRNVRLSVPAHMTASLAS